MSSFLKKIFSYNVPFMKLKDIYTQLLNMILFWKRNYIFLFASKY